MKTHISVVIPVYGCAACLQDLYSRLVKTLEAIDPHFEIILVNDESPDDAWKVINDLCKRDKRVRGINLSRNFGQHNAIIAGLHYTAGKWIIVMDCDLQDPPEEIIKLYKKAKEGFKIVFAQRLDRSDHFLKRTLSGLFHKLFSYLTDTRQDKSIGNYGIYHRDVIKSVVAMGDPNKFFPTMVQWVGFKKTKIRLEHHERSAGKSGYTFRSLLSLAINTIIAFSDKPLRLTVKIGSIITIFSIIAGLVMIWRYFTGNIEVSGYTSLIVSLWFLSGVIIAILGMIGLYIGKMFEKIKKRPNFIIESTRNMELHESS
ncbi:glycosyltransferase [bacterium I07]|nr:glycosyltransferase [bacterium I07]